MSALTLTDIRKSYGAVEILKGIDLDVATGEFVVFVGPSGCGKSTLLRLIAGLDEISAGTMAIGGVRMNEVDPSRRGLAMVFQSYALYPHMTVEQNMGFALRFAGMPKAEIRSRVLDAARVLDLEPLLKRKPRALSGGQRQRVAIGRAIVRQPKLFLFDEPLSNLDAELRVHMRIEIAKLHRRLGVTTIYVTHDQVEAMTLADRIVVLRAGAVEQIGSPLALYDDPDNLFVAGFIGSPKMNLLPAVGAATPMGAPALRIAALGDALIPLPPGAPKVAEGAPVTSGIRPEQFDPAGPVGLDLTVDIVEHLGGTNHVHARKGDAPPIVVDVREGRTLRPGDPITVRFDPAALHLFGTDGKRLRA
ncbi:ABC transporter ATP-binding protein [Prosthecomicrobium pneumaticum]|uniref:Lactose/L-arabinose transport system ATP-binding protein n=1 Tax=Prosthecomicrobium pneumaticum TaxID=81895 RepID=A0A7W9FLJ9_9HYPH|nr:sn-glycerol-3-phosphate ABC transporter ATP-binding protein UgpC [Prosthecomicrobium pneumaticum]MBB5752896.1 lactose/L-arabinose transport system ATP-binding protein [Prosthecomicrobium pneumaticum]